MTVSRPEGHPTDVELTDSLVSGMSLDAATHLNHKSGHGCGICLRNIVLLGDALLGERAAHTATKAALERLRDTAHEFLANDLPDEVAEMAEWLWTDADRATAALSVSGEFGESSK